MPQVIEQSPQSVHNDQLPSTKIILLIIIIFTLFKCQVDLALRHTSWGHCQLKLIRVKFNQMQVFEVRGKPEYPGKNLSKQRREPTTNSTHI